MRYSNYLSFCVESVNVELIFASSFIKTFHSFWLTLALFEHFMVNFSKSYPLKAPELAMSACFGLMHLPHTELTWSETSPQLSQCGVRLHVN